jgi:histidinol-phosphate aminotransferase
LLNRVRQPFNVNSLALSGALAALDDRAFIDASVTMNAQGVEQLRSGLAALGLASPPSAANFVLADMGKPAAPLFESLLRRGVITRPVGNYGLPNHLRITVGTREQNQRLLLALEEVLHDGEVAGAAR